MIKSAFRYDEVKIKPEHQIGRHSHDDWELSMILTGAGMRTIGNMSEPMSEGEIVLIPPRIEHEWAFDSAHTDNNGDIHNISVFFSTEILQSLKALLPELHTSLETLMALEYAVVYSGKRHARIRQLLLDTADCHRARRSNRRSNSEESMERVRVFCECNYARTVKLPEVAAVAAMNKSSFCTFIRRLHQRIILQPRVSGPFQHHPQRNESSEPISIRSHAQAAHPFCPCSAITYRQ